MFISAGNSGAGLNTIGDPSVASKVMSVGSYITNETWRSNYGSSTVNGRQDNLHPFSSRGPREDGGFKPQIIAPGSAVSTIPDVAEPGAAGAWHVRLLGRVRDVQRDVDGLAAGGRSGGAARVSAAKAGRRTSTSPTSCVRR